MNNFNAIGRVCNDLEIKESQNKKNYLRFDLAITSNYKNKDGNKDTDFITCVAFNQLAKVINEHVDKGDQIGIVGQLKSNNYTNQEGIKIKTTTIVLEKVDLMSNKKHFEGSLAASTMSNDDTDEYDEIFNELSLDFNTDKVL